MVNLQFEDLDSIKLPLLQRFYKHHYPSAKPKKNERVIVARHQAHLCAAVRFRPIDRYQLLTGMTVDESLREQGIGHQLLTYCELNVLDEQVFCFSFPWLETFYQQHNFQTLAVNTLPNSLKVLFQRYENSGKKLIPMQYTKPLDGKEISHYPSAFII
jgi:N-acetylglutamate synthase-like GNAT family acetyltransferase